MQWSPKGFANFTICFTIKINFYGLSLEVLQA